MRQWSVLIMIEILNPGARAPQARIGLFDFDGTISTIRSGWVEIMVPMMVDILAELKTGESAAALHEVVLEFVGRLTGKETIYQMMEFVENIEKRGGEALTPLEYKTEYLRRLNIHIAGRIAELEAGCPKEKYLVPGAVEFLEALQARGLKLYLASGTDDAYVKRESALLDVAKYFNGGVFGAQDDLKSFSKGMLVAKIISTAEAAPSQIIGFGDGYVEIDEVKKVGGLGVGLATDEPECRNVDAWKRDRLAKVGADFIVPNFLEKDALLAAIF
jgi:phosphoglycolate phosphatase-like HAD superfamily hydrolase